MWRTLETCWLSVTHCFVAVLFLGAVTQPRDWTAKTTFPTEIKVLKTKIPGMQRASLECHVKTQDFRPVRQCALQPLRPRRSRLRLYINSGRGTGCVKRSCCHALVLTHYGVWRRRGRWPRCGRTASRRGRRRRWGLWRATAWRSRGSTSSAAESAAPLSRSEPRSSSTCSTSGPCSLQVSDTRCQNTWQSVSACDTWDQQVTKVAWPLAESHKTNVVRCERCTQCTFEPQLRAADQNLGRGHKYARWVKSSAMVYFLCEWDTVLHSEVARRRKSWTCEATCAHVPRVVPTHTRSSAT